MSPNLLMALGRYAEGHGGMVFSGPTGVLLAQDKMVGPDVLFVGPDEVSRLEGRYIEFPPDLVVEVSSPSTRRLDTVRKRALYERFRVPEHWYVDLESERIEVNRLKGDRYAKPAILGRGELLESPVLPGFSVEIDYFLGPARR